MEQKIVDLEKEVIELKAELQDYYAAESRLHAEWNHQTMLAEDPNY